MNRKFRLRNRSDLERVRRTGKSYAHPLLVLVTLPNLAGDLRIAVMAGKSVGGAVIRNLVKRRVREAVRPLIYQLPRGKDLIFIARKPAATAPFAEIQQTVIKLLQRSGYLRLDHEPDEPYPHP